MMMNLIINLAAVSLPDFSSTTDFGKFISDLYIFSLSIVGVIIFVRFVWAGWIYLSAAGNIGNVSKAKEMMQNAIIGAIILIASYLILYTINPDLVKLDVLLKVPAQSGNTNATTSPSSEIPKMSLKAIQPISGPTGTEVYVTGTNLDDVNMIVAWDGKALGFESNGPTEFHFTVPFDATSGGHILSVELNGNSGRLPFIVK